jgi:hypothetical protein
LRTFVTILYLLVLTLNPYMDKQSFSPLHYTFYEGALKMNAYMTSRASVSACLISRKHGPNLLKFNTGVFYKKLSNHIKFNFNLICRNWATVRRFFISYEVKTCVSLKVNRRFRETCYLSIEDLFATCLVLVYSLLSFQAWRCMRQVIPQYSLDFNEIYGVLSKNVKLFDITFTILDIIHSPVFYLKKNVSGLDSVSVFRFNFLIWAQ